MSVDLAPALVAGALGGVVMLALGAAARSRAAQFDPAVLWAALLALPPERGRLAGTVVHVTVSGVVGVVYALGFRLADATDAGLAWGLVGSVAHWLVAGVFVGLRRGAGELGRDELGAFASNLGPAGAVGFLVAHLAYGAVFAVVYFAIHPAGGLGAVF